MKKLNTASRDILIAEEYMELMEAIQTMKINSVVKSIISIDLLYSKLESAVLNGGQVTTQMVSIVLHIFYIIANCSRCNAQVFLTH